MAIKNFKEIIDNKGYRLLGKDRKIFEEQSLQSFFGFSEKDAIEFIIYDINDNQLPQENGELVKYIPLNSQNIANYFLIPEGTLLQSFELPKEYFIDVERLVREAGYNNGIFKTQITLVNKRAGSEIDGDKLWIQEISPSRTELRLLPLKINGAPNVELEERFNLFVRDGEFREDTIFEALNFVQKIDPSVIVEKLNLQYGNGFLNTLKDEFQIENLDSLIITIYNKFVEACIYEFSNRESNLNSENYGKPLNAPPSISLSKNQIVEKCIYLLTSAISKYFPVVNFRGESEIDYRLVVSEDEIEKIIQRRESDTIVDSSEPELNIVQQITGTETNIDINLTLTSCQKVEKNINPNGNINDTILCQGKEYVWNGTQWLIKENPLTSLTDCEKVSQQINPNGNTGDRVICDGVVYIWSGNSWQTYNTPNSGGDGRLDEDGNPSSVVANLMTEDIR